MTAVVPTPSRSLSELTRAPRAWLARWLTPLWRRRLFRLLNALSLAAAAAALYYAVTQLAATELQPAWGYTLLVGAIYVLTFAMQLVGWHRLALRFAPGLALRDHLEAVAASNLLKRLPTVAFYIAGRAERYAAHAVPPGAVVTVAILELALMVSGGALLLLCATLAASNLLLAGLALLLVCALLALLLRPAGLAERWLAQRTAGAAPLTTARWWWVAPTLWYWLTWPIGVLLLWGLVRIVSPVGLADLLPLAAIWAAAGVAGILASLGLGGLGFVRELTLVALLTPRYGLPVAIAASLAARVALLGGETACSLLIMAAVRLRRGRP